MQRSLINLWTSIFSSAQPASKITSSISRKRGHDSSSARSGNSTDAIDRLTAMIGSSDDMDKLMQGCFEHYLSTKVADGGGLGSSSSGSSTSRIEQALDWFEFYDILDRRIHSRMDWQLAKYQPYTMATLHRLFATVKKQHIEFPKADYEVCRCIKENERRMGSFSSYILSNQSSTFWQRNILRIYWRNCTRGWTH